MLFRSVNWPYTTPLPINLLFFNAQPTKEKVVTTWETSSELNNNFFTVERSRDGFNFESIGIVQGQGNSTSLHHYEYEDNRPLKGISYYRLRQTDFDGRSTLSRMIAVNFADRRDFQCAAYPNPFTDKVFLNISSSQAGEVRFVLSDEKGKIVNTELRNLCAGFSTYELQTAEIENGIYFLSVESSDNFFHKIGRAHV